MEERQDKDVGNPDLLRCDIDSGRTGDKISHSDPAVAQPGTDEEAAGTPLTKAQIERTRQKELELARNARRKLERFLKPGVLLLVAVELALIVGLIVFALR